MTRATILVIEDDRHRVPELEERLTTAGYSVLRMPLTGPEAIGEVAAMAPDLVLMDIAIRGRTDGVQAADLIQSNLDIPVIYIMPKDAYGQLTLQRARATGPFGYIFDPQDMRQLCSTIEVALLRNGLEREIKEGRQWLSTVLHSIGDGVVAVDERGLITFINPIAEALTGWEAADAVGKPLLEAVCVEEQNARGMISAGVSGGGNGAGADIQAGMHATLNKRGGGAVPVEITVSPIRGSDHRVKGMVLVFRDVTERRKAVHEIQRQAQRAEALGKLQAEHQALTAERASLQGEVAALKEEREHFRRQKTQVTNMKQLTAVVSELDHVEAQLKPKEDRLQEITGKLQGIEEQIASLGEEAPEERALREKAEGIWAEARKAGEAEFQEVDRELRRVQRELGDVAMAQFKKLWSQRKPLAVVAMEGEACAACHADLRPSLVQLVRTMEELQYCDSCRRLLYDPEQFPATP